MILAVFFKAEGQDALPEVIVVLFLLKFAELLLNGAELFTQEVVALVFFPSAS